MLGSSCWSAYCSLVRGLRLCLLYIFYFGRCESFSRSTTTFYESPALSLTFTFISYGGVAIGPIRFIQDVGRQDMC